MRSLNPSRRPGSLRVPGMVVAAAALGLGLFQVRDLAAGEKPTRGMPRGSHFGPAVSPEPNPNPIPSPIPVPAPFPFPFPFAVFPGLTGAGMTGPTDRCLIVAPATLDARSIRTADASIDAGIFGRPGVQGLPVRGPSTRQGSRR
jgi:hypothetical protein